MVSYWATALIFKLILVVDGWGISPQLSSDECHWTLLISQGWFRWWLGVIRQQTIALANADQDLCYHMVSLGHNESMKPKVIHNWSQGLSSHCVGLIILVEYSKLTTRRVNTLRPRQNGRHFPDDSFKWIFLNVNVWILIEVSLKFVPKGPINNIPALVQIMVWWRPGDKPLSEPMMVSLLTHICVTRPQWVKSFIKVSQAWHLRIFDTWTQLLQWT